MSDPASRPSPPSSSWPPVRAPACGRRRPRCCTPSAGAACSATCWPRSRRSAAGTHGGRRRGRAGTRSRRTWPASPPTPVPVRAGASRTGSGHAAAVALDAAARPRGAGAASSTATRRCCAPAPCARWWTRTARPGTRSPCSPPRWPTRPGWAGSSATATARRARPSSRSATPPPSSGRSARSTPGVYVGDAAAVRRALARRRRRPTTRASSTSPTSWACWSPTARRSAGVRADDPDDVLGCNDRRELAARRRTLNDRVLDDLMRAGVTVVDPQTTWVDVTVDGRPGRRPAPGHPAARRDHGGRRAPSSARTPRCTDTEVGEGARVVRSHAELAVVGPDGHVGPFAYLRPGTRLARGAKVGTFVETKNVEVGEGSKVPHLSYVGRRHHRRGHQHRRRHRLRQLRRRGQAPHDDRRPRPHRRGQHVRRAGHRRGRRLHRGRVGDHHRRPAGGHGRGPGAAAQCGRLGAPPPAGYAPRPQAAEAAATPAAAAGDDDDDRGTPSR